MTYRVEIGSGLLETVTKKDITVRRSSEFGSHCVSPRAKAREERHTLDVSSVLTGGCGMAVRGSSRWQAPMMVPLEKVGAKMVIDALPGCDTEGLLARDKIDSNKSE